MQINWIGTKKKMMPQLLCQIPTNYNNYFEPFLGGGALFQTITPPTAILNDNDNNLMELWQNMLAKPELFCNCVRKFEDTIYTNKDQKTQKKTFKLFVDRFNKSNFGVFKSALFYTLLKYAFRGIFRYRPDGTIHLSYGFKSRIKKPIIDFLELQRIKTNVKNLKLLNGDFGSVITQAQSNDFIFIDPPYYREGIKDKDFYQHPFTFEDHIRLYKYLKEANHRNVKWLYTNYNSAKIIKLFEDFNIQTIKTTTSHALTSQRGLQEVIIKNY
ncbi:Dam family site-specific DNA-(adenine-N6)-methyltransferase [Paulownia witches'-broom phytoplasma]|uniref:Dam family site-specific DNA-(Adenine-N6)-methyltransferase n=1 Tax=Paulownia witches'-broom phytoplasma TaxID=39647 RepID=A0ABX8TR64_9MOLU|nr:Dam family site-specific DNA-(adenine-N6)-methyltransferase [Paulownia witches'-broom phytoplasma]QYC31165.1 Dam family site-specific DNA-(adenine-N6)-methyltransferase [Paulownia witches'-broom phytoplasma]QYC31182.1 Dam family site-specific DNA-(adenine-N6)-methyltransferase [Paulownia witches'-broom phytoplasma]QYC31228.1 Dam family site-specific DNA-(adenine-N6)-methyltransferase [Paulownia witches'-broom phytoplasma]QYC31305.1 Dam family site-specific DNA-(adenine-N6)-methyltransferase 